MANGAAVFEYAGPDVHSTDVRNADGFQFLGRTEIKKNFRSKNPAVTMTVLGGGFQPTNAGAGVEYTFKTKVVNKTKKSLFVEIYVRVREGFGILRNLTLGISVVG